MTSDWIKSVISIAAFLISLASFLVAMRSANRAAKAATITSLLGEKESVAFAALKLQREGLPNGKKDRGLLISAVVQACVFSSSDRARAILYSVIESYLPTCGDEIRGAAHSLAKIFAEMNKYNFTKDDLDLARGKRRLEALERVLNHTATGA